MIRRTITYTSLFSILLACDGTNFTGDSNSSRHGPSATGDHQGVGQPGIGPNNGGDDVGVGPEEAKRRLEVIEDNLRRQQAERDRLGDGADSDNALGGACALFARSSEKANLKKVALTDGSSTPEVIDSINIADLARNCTPNGNDCHFEFHIYSDYDQTKYYYALPPGDLAAGHKATIYKGTITNYRLASCDVVALRNSDPVDRTKDGCFAPETKIMTDTGEKMIRDIAVGDMVYSPISRDYSPVSNITVGPEAKALIEVGYHGKTVRVTTEHPFVTESGLKQAQELTKADRLLTEKEGVYATIETLRQLPLIRNQRVYNIEILGKGFAKRVIIADGIVTGDLGMQKELTKERLIQPNFNQPLAISIY